MKLKFLTVRGASIGVAGNYVGIRESLCVVI